MSWNLYSYQPRYDGRRIRRYRNFLPSFMRASERDLRFWRHYYPLEAREAEANALRRARERDSMRVRPEEADKAEELTIEEIDLLDRGKNAMKHNTSKYSKEIQPVLRRGQEFKMTITLSREYRKSTDDMTFIFKADEENTSKDFYAEIKLDETGSAMSRGGKEWSARIIKARGDKMKVAVYVPPNIVVGEWNLEVKTSLVGKEDEYVYECGQSLFILFNPWCDEDEVYLSDTHLLKEYLLNDCGTFYFGSYSNIGSRSWIYGQFRKGILEICMSILRKAFDYRMTVEMANAETVARALSRILNAPDDNGVVVGNWSGNYAGGKSPTQWTNSVDILRTYDKTEMPVKFGQCWVFSHVLTSVCRALGFPCRSVTNFASAHDTDGNCIIDEVRTPDGTVIRSARGNDSVWNFHVWNEVWLRSPSMDRIYHGWCVIDATPQERSEGLFQCGPCPVKAVKRGDINIGYDTAFVFSEVNADKITWVQQPDGTRIQTEVDVKAIGKRISTKPPDGKPHKQNLNDYNEDDPTLRLDITSEYKFLEGTSEEREAVAKAVRRSGRDYGRPRHEMDLEVKFMKGNRTVLGNDLVMKAAVKNKSRRRKAVSVFMAAHTCQYWDPNECENILGRQTSPRVYLKPGEEAIFDLTITEANYMKKVNKDLSVNGYVRATDEETEIPYSAQNIFTFTVPDLVIKGPKVTYSGQSVSVTASLRNYLPKPLTRCMLTLTGTLNVAPNDTNPIESNLETHVLRLKDIPAKKSIDVTVRLVGRLEPEDDDNTKHMQFNFTCRELECTSDGTYVLDLFG